MILLKYAQKRAIGGSAMMRHSVFSYTGLEVAPGGEIELSVAPIAMTELTRQRKVLRFTSRDIVGSPEKRGRSPAQPVTRCL